MAVRKVLGQVLSTAGVDVDLYTVPADTDAVVSSILVCNQDSGASATIRIRVKIGGAAADAKQYIVKDPALGASTTVAFSHGLTLAEGDVIAVNASTSTVSFHAYGQEQAT
jgi:hypothetical protein